MKKAPLFLIGLFAALVLSWVGLVFGTHAQIGRLTPYYDQSEESAYPVPPSGIAAQGELVYVDLGCAACHTQQVRRPDYGSDQARGWGERQSVARDYIFQARPQLGDLRYGPDLANLALRKPTPPDTADLMRLLYAGSQTHPSYPFLFETRRIVGQRSNRALNLPSRLAPRRGYEVVPTRRAESLAGYLQNLKQPFEYPEARPVAPAPAESASGAQPAAAPAQPAAQPSGAAQPPPAAPSQPPPSTQPPPDTEKANPPGKRPEQAVPAAAPDEKKKLPNK